jgi:hypothetical protein
VNARIDGMGKDLVYSPTGHDIAAHEDGDDGVMRV